MFKSLEIFLVIIYVTKALVTFYNLIWLSLFIKLISNLFIYVPMPYYECCYILSKSKKFNTNLNYHLRKWILNIGYDFFGTY
jgi:hypothetical protein